MALTDKLSAIGVAIREKTGKTELLTLEQMPIEIASITTGGGNEDCNGLHIPEEVMTVSGSCSARFSYGYWDWFITMYGDKIVTQNIDNCINWFIESKLESIPFEINCNPSSNITFDYMFRNCKNLKEIPKINNAKCYSMAGMFYDCPALRNVPEDLESWFDWSYVDNATSSWNGGKRGQGIFYGCFSLRSAPMGFLNHENPYVTSSNSMYYNLFYYCYALDEVVGLPIPNADKMAHTSNLFSSTFGYCYRLKNMTFATKEDGSPIVVNLKGQTIDLTTVGFGGYATSAGNMLNYNSGITADKQVKDDATYQALKDDPDWFTVNEAYSRYNHDSAVATINSLPDTTSSGGTNTIKFKGAAGSATDGGAINTLTEEEIAVAAAKGWSVTFV